MQSEPRVCPNADICTAVLDCLSAIVLRHAYLRYLGFTVQAHKSLQNKASQAEIVTNRLDYRPFVV